MFKKIAFVKTKYPWLQSPLDVKAFYCHIVCVTTLEYQIIWEKGLENVLKISNKKGWSKLGGFKNKSHAYFD